MKDYIENPSYKEAISYITGKLVVNHGYYATEPLLQLILEYYDDYMRTENDE